MMRQSIQFKQGQKQFWSIRVLLVVMATVTGLGIYPAPAHAIASDRVAFAAVVDPIASPPSLAPDDRLERAGVEIPDRAASPGISYEQASLRSNTSSGVQDIILQEFAGTGAGSRAIKVAKCESRLVASAVHLNRNGSKDHGLFQFNDGGTAQTMLKKFGYAWNALYNARLNARMAHALWSQTHSFARWTCGRR